MSNTTTLAYDALGRLLRYPEDGQTLRLNECVKALEAADSAGLDQVKLFVDHAHTMSYEDHQEWFTRTFDINPVCALEVGWQLFGERYERGTFIVKMRQTLRELDLPESTELPDHLIHVLEALGRMQPDEAKKFADMFVLPAVKKMLVGFKAKDNVYSHLLEGISMEVSSRYQLAEQGANNG